MSDSITTVNGSMNLLVAGNGGFGKLTAPDTVRVEVFGNQLDIDADIIFDHPDRSPGGNTQCCRMSVSETLLAQADNIVLPEVFNPGNGDLHISLTGNDGGLADTSKVQTSGGGKVVFDVFKVSNFELSFNNDLVAFYGIEVGEIGFITTPNHRIAIDNVNRSLYEGATAQLNSLNKPFDLLLYAENRIDTTALPVNYSPNYIVNQFSTDNSLTRLEPKRGTLPEKTSARLIQDITLLETMVMNDMMS